MIEWAQRILSESNAGITWLNSSVGLVLGLPWMSTKQPAVAVDSRSNRRSLLCLLRPPLVRSDPSGIPFFRFFEQV